MQTLCYTKAFLARSICVIKYIQLTEYIRLTVYAYINRTERSFSYCMVNISKRDIGDAQRADICRQLLDVFVKAHDRQHSRRAIESLLSEAELIQLAKRLAIIVMLVKKVPAYRIQKMLEVSPSTIHTHAEKLSDGEYQDIERLIDTDTRTKESEVTELIIDFVRIGMMPYATRSRWRWLDEMRKSTKSR